MDIRARHSSASAAFSNSHARWIASIALLFASCIGLRVSMAQTTDQLSGDVVLKHLNAVITWYGNLRTNVPSSSQPSDAIYLNNAQNLAQEAVRLAFQSAEVEAGIIGTQNKGAAAGAVESSPGGGQQDFSQMQSKIAATIADVQSQIEKLNGQIAGAAGSKRQALRAQRDRLQGELQLDQAMQDSIQKLATFESSSESASTGLLGNINQLKRSVPEVFGQTPQQKTASPPANSNQGYAKSTGLIGQALDLYREIRGMHQIDQLSDETADVRQTVQDVRKPLHDALTATVQRGRDLANQAAPDSSKAESVRQQFQDITNRFKTLADASVPLAQETLVLDQSRANLYEWRRAMQGEFRTVLEALLVRVVLMAIALVIIFLVSEIWRRFTFRYVRDVRRRRQFLILRRFVIGFLFALVIILGFVSEFSSLATFAGFITAGIAVSLQAVLLSIAAYFFLIGRYGINVGDRISVAGVTGDVVDIGLVRLSVMELAGNGIELYPTGRVVVLSNSVLFQATTPLFKQIPGTEFTWHEVAVSLAPSGNYKAVQDKLVAAVNSVYSTYREQMESQHRFASRQIDITLSMPEPHASLAFAEAGLEVQVRYPVDIRQVSEVDDQVTRKVLEIITGDADLRGSVVGSPKIRATVKG
jgi:small-conductance mechanosensitive channel